MRRRLNWFALGLALMITLTACGQAQPVPTQPTATPQPVEQPKTKEVMKLKYASAVTPPNMVHIAPYVALDAGFFKGEALDAEIISLEGGVGTARALLAGMVDVSGTSADPILAQSASNPGEELMMAFYTYAPRITNAMVCSADVKSGKDLKGKKIGIQETNAFAHVLSQLVLRRAGIKNEEVTFVSGSTSGRLPNLLQGVTDTAILHVEQTLKAIEDNPQLNFCSRIWEEEPKWWYSAFAGNSKKMKSEPELYERFTRAMIKTNRWMYQPENKEKVLEIYMKYNKGFTKEQASKTYDTLVAGKNWPKNEGVSREIVEYTINTQVELQLLKLDDPSKKPKFEDVFYPDIINKVLKELGRDGTNDL